jgi:mono/diheme cytochrome c family protein
MWLVSVVLANVLVASAAAGELSRGRALVDVNCARCHAVGTEGRSPHPQAPPFRILSERYPIEALEEALAEGISVGHPDMPEFVVEPEQIAAILAYIESIQEQRPPHGNGLH